MKMKKLIALILAVLMMASAAAAEGPLSGGWTASADPAVTEELKALFEKGTEALTGAGFSAEDINTGYISLYAVYDYSGDVESITGYNATSTLSIRVTDMARTGEVIDLAFGAGANTLNGVTFSVSDESEARAEALKAAVADAKAKAAVLAEAAGFGEIEIVSVTEGSVSSFDSGLNNFSRKAAGMDTVEEATVVQAAKLVVSVTVTVVYEAE